MIGQWGPTYTCHLYAMGRACFNLEISCSSYIVNSGVGKAGG